MTSGDQENLQTFFHGKLEGRHLAVLDSPVEDRLAFVASVLSGGGGEEEKEEEEQQEEVKEKKYR